MAAIPLLAVEILMQTITIFAGLAQLLNTFWEDYIGLQDILWYRETLDSKTIVVGPMPQNGIKETNTFSNTVNILLVALTNKWLSLVSQTFIAWMAFY